MKKPDFFIVGAPKSGTTSMCEYLNKHPQIFIPEIKEPNFFGSDLTGIRNFSTIEEYLDLFKGNEDLLCGEGSTWYLFSKTAAQQIYNYNPEAKIIIMLREPVSLLYSLHSQMLYDGFNEDIEDFKSAIKAENDRKNGNRIPKKCKRKEALFYSEVVKFTEQVERYFHVFGRKKVHVIIFDDFKNQTSKVYKETLDFLGVNSNFRPEFKIINANKKVRSKVLRNFLQTPPPIIKKTAKVVLPSLFRKFLSYNLKKMNTKYVPRPPMDPDLRKQLQEKFKPEIENLSKLLGRDLSHWFKNDK